MAQFGLDDPVQLRAIDADAVQQRADDAVALASMAASRCSGSICGMPAVGGQRLRRGDGLLGLDGQFVEAECHDISSGPLSLRERVRVRAVLSCPLSPRERARVRAVLHVPSPSGREAKGERLS